MRRPSSRSSRGETGSEVIKADLREKGDEDVFRKIRADFDAAGISISDEEIRTRMVDLLTEATNQINPQD